MDKQDNGSKRIEELLKDLMVIQLAIAGVGQREIREIVGGNMAKINKTVKRIRKSLKKTSNAKA